MEENELSGLLNQFDARLSRSDEKIQKLTKEINFQKTESELNKMTRQSIFELLLGLLVSVILIGLMSSGWNEPAVVISAGLILLFTVAALVGCIHQLELISRFDISKPVTENQKVLAGMQTHLILYLKIAILQFPFFLAYIILGFWFFFGINIWEVGDSTWLISQIVLGLLFLPLSIWAIKTISYKNMHIKWVNMLISGAGGKKLTLAMEFLKEIEDYEKSN
ncbi:MAG: keratin [Bacteroidetes bacterium]|nr:keratin [Bacteroidota bacterium]